MKQISKEYISGFEIIRLKEVESTNLYVRACLDKGLDLNHGTIVLAEKQILGKGMGDNTWDSEAGKNLNLSILLKPQSLPPEKQFVLNKAIALAVSDFVMTIIPDKEIRIKWPNDIYIEDKKVAGILISNTIKGNTLEDVIVGIGINVNQKNFPQNIPNPVSLRKFSKKKLNLNECLDSLCIFLRRRYEEIILGEIQMINSEYISRLYRLDEIHNFKSGDENFTARIIGVSEYGQLQLRTKYGDSLEFGFKEVEYVI